MRTVNPVFIAREEGDDAMHHLGVVPGDGSDSYIAELIHLTDYNESLRQWEYDTITMCDASSLSEYEFIRQDSLDEVDVETVIDELKEAAA